MTPTLPTEMDPELSIQEIDNDNNDRNTSGFMQTNSIDITPSKVSKQEETRGMEINMK